MDRDMRNFLLIIVLLVSGTISAQVSFNAGGSVMKGFSSPWYTGFHAGLEIPRDDALSFYGRVTHLFHQTAEDSISFNAQAIDFTTTFPSVLTVKGLPSMNYTIIEGGTRFYLGNGFDFGFAAYGGTNFMLALNKVKVNYDDFDETLYEIQPAERVDGGIFGIGAGLLGGVKYSVPRYGTFYFDAGISYLFLVQGTQQNVYGALHSSLLFAMNLGYRYDIVW